ncbi:MAG: DEAD/DEAH box helicase, partial [Nanoarchaeota archaeon]|nr:DEAD/DEAH box helicase [Nanoarchaeota archaeon]
MTLFEELGLSEQLLAAIKRLGITTPTLIQEKSIPHIIAGKDVIGESATGSGKTIAFGCGIVEKVVPRQGLQALVLAPTRELAEQVTRSLRAISDRNMRILAIYGGVSINPQIDMLSQADVVVATPGRLLDHMERRTINLSKIKILVLDEADRMLDMGFIDDVEKIMRNCPKNRQTLFFSATISQDIRDLSERYMKHPEDVWATKMVDP